MSRKGRRPVKTATDTAVNIGLLVPCAVLFAVASVCQSPAHAETVREKILMAAPSSRNEAFTAFLTQHGKACAVNESKFTTNVRHFGDNGDVWSVRCAEGPTFAIFIADDAKSTSWFMPCNVVQRRSNLRCFEQPPQNISFK